MGSPENREGWLWSRFRLVIHQATLKASRNPTDFLSHSRLGNICNTTIQSLCICIDYFPRNSERPVLLLGVLGVLWGGLQAVLAVGWAGGSGAPCKWTDSLSFPLSPFWGRLPAGSAMIQAWVPLACGIRCGVESQSPDATFCGLLCQRQDNSLRLSYKSSENSWGLKKQAGGRFQRTDFWCHSGWREDESRGKL